MTMPTPTSRRAPPADALIEERDTLCAELIALERESAPRVTRAAAIEARLKQIADERGESFKVTLANGDFVRVAPPLRPSSRATSRWSRPKHGRHSSPPSSEPTSKAGSSRSSRNGGGRRAGGST
jgi:hypothetical protein